MKQILLSKPRHVSDPEYVARKKKGRKKEEEPMSSPVRHVELQVMLLVLLLSSIFSFRKKLSLIRRQPF